MVVEVVVVVVDDAPVLVLARSAEGRAVLAPLVVRDCVGDKLMLVHVVVAVLTVFVDELDEATVNI